MRIILAILLLSLATPGLAQFCAAAGEKDKQQEKQVSLLHPTDDPTYYYRVSQMRVALWSALYSARTLSLASARVRDRSGI